MAIGRKADSSVALGYIIIVTVTCTLKHWISYSSIECFLLFIEKSPLSICVFMVEMKQECN